MSEMENIKKYILIDDLFNLFLDVKYESEDEDVFGTGSEDVEKIVNKNLMLFRKLRTQTKAELNRVKHERVLDFLSKLREGIKSNVEEYRTLADEILSKPKFAKLQTMFRNYDTLSEQDKQSILFDVELLDMLSDIEEEYNSKKKNE